MCITEIKIQLVVQFICIDSKAAENVQLAEEIRSEQTYVWYRAKYGNCVQKSLPNVRSSLTDSCGCAFGNKLLTQVPYLFSRAEHF